MFNKLKPWSSSIIGMFNSIDAFKIDLQTLNVPDVGHLEVELENIYKFKVLLLLRNSINLNKSVHTYLATHWMFLPTHPRNVQILHSLDS